MDHRVQKIIDLMNSDGLYRKLTLDEMAQFVSLSPSRFRHLFKAEIGCSPTRYLKLFRLQKAKDLLEATELSVKQIMGQVGMSDESHFVRDFQQVYNLPPTKYRVRVLGAKSSAGGSK